MERLKLERLDGGEHGIGMAIDLDMAPAPGDSAIRTDQNHCAKNAMEGPAIHGFFAPSAVSFQHLMLLIRNKRRGQLVLVSKGLLDLWRAGGNAQYRGPTVGKRAGQPREVDGLLGTARRVGARIEKQ